MKNQIKQMATLPFRNHEQGSTAFQQVLEKGMLLVLLVFPLWFIIQLFFQSTDRQLRTVSGYGIVVLMIAFVAIVFLFLFLIGKLGTRGRLAEVYTTGAICALAFSLRLLSVTILQTGPVSDFASCYGYATVGSNAQYMTDFHYLGFYALTIKAFMRVFGQSVFMAQMLAVLVTSAIPAILFHTAKAAFQSARIGAVAALMYAIFPSMLIYVNVLSCENFSMFFLALTVLFLVLGWRRRHDGKKHLAFYALAGISVGLMNLYKPLMIIILVSLAAVEFVFYLLPVFAKLLKKVQIPLSKAIQPVIAVCLVVALGSVTTFAGKAILYRDTGLKPAHKSSYVVMAFEGLYSKGKGSYNKDVKQMVRDIKRQSATLAEAEQTLIRLLADDIKKDIGAFAFLQGRKFIVGWCSEVAYTKWATESTRSLLDVSRSQYLLRILPDLFYLMLVFGIIAGVAARLVRNRKGAYPYLLMGAVVLLVGCMFLIIEAQGRYKSTIMPVFCVMSAVGFAETARFLKWAAAGTLRKIFELGRKPESSPSP